MKIGPGVGNGHRRRIAGKGFHGGQGALLDHRAVPGQGPAKGVGAGVGEVEAIEDAVGKKATKNMMPMQAGDVPSTSADVTELEQAVGFKPNTPVKQGIAV